MHLYKKYNLPDTVNFLDVELTKDNRKWIDPMMIYMDKSDMGVKCSQIILEYFSELLELAIAKDDEKGYEYTKYFTEMNETRLGYSSNQPRGLSGGESLGMEIYNTIKNSKAMNTEMIGDIFDASVVIQGLGVDKISDFISSIIFEELIKFTQDECIKNNIPMEIVTIKKPYWSYDKQEWIYDVKVNLPYDEESQMPIVFVPKNFVEKKVIYSHQRFYTHGMIPYYGREAISNRIEGLIRILKNGKIKADRAKIKEKYPCTRDNVIEFIQEHQDVYHDYKRKQLSYIGYKNYK